MGDPLKVKVTERLLDINTYKKYLGYIIITLAVILITFGGYSLYRYFFPKKPTQQNTITVQSGGQATIIQKSNDRKAIIPFVEGGAEARDKEKIGAFLRAGVRVEF